MKKAHREKIQARLNRVSSLFNDKDLIVTMMTRVTSGAKQAEIKQRTDDLFRLLQVDVPELLDAVKPCARHHVLVDETKLSRGEIETMKIRYEIVDIIGDKIAFDLIREKVELPVKMRAIRMEDNEMVIVLEYQHGNN